MIAAYVPALDAAALGKLTLSGARIEAKALPPDEIARTARLLVHSGPLGFPVFDPAAGIARPCTPKK